MTTRFRSKRESEWAAQQARRKKIIIGAWIGAGVLFVAMLGYLIWQEAQPEPRPGEAIPIQGNEHIQVGAPHQPYNSDPPTSGPHYETPADAAFYDDPVADEYLVHSLEHGYVIIWYNCSELSEEACTTLKEQIRSAMGSSGVSAVTGTLKLIAMPRPTMETTLALTSWGRLQRLDAFDRDAIRTFIRVYRDQAPEPAAP